MRGMLRRRVNHSPANRNRTLISTCSAYSGSTSGFRLAHWSMGFL